MEKLTVLDAIALIDDFLTGSGEDKEGYNWLMDVYNVDNYTEFARSIKMAKKKEIINSAIEGFRTLAKIEMDCAKYVDKQEALESVMRMGDVAEALEFLRTRYEIQP